MSSISIGRSLRFADLPSSVATLPTAAAEPIVQPQRRGRYPRNVIPLWRGRVIQERAQQRQRELDQATQTRAEVAMVMQQWDRHIAELQARARRGRVCPH